MPVTAMSVCSVCDSNVCLCVCDGDDLDVCLWAIYQPFTFLITGHLWSISCIIPDAFVSIICYLLTNKTTKLRFKTIKKTFEYLLTQQNISETCTQNIRQKCPNIYSDNDFYWNLVCLRALSR